MKEPRRLRHESKSPMERALLETAASYRRPPSTRAKTIAALGLTGSAALSAGGALGAWTKVAAQLGGVKALISVAALGGAIALPAAYYGSRLRSTAVSPTSGATARVPNVASVAAPSEPAATALRFAISPQQTPPLTSGPIAPSRDSLRRSTVERAELQRPSVAASRQRTVDRNIEQLSTQAPVPTNAAPANAAELSAEVAAVEASRARLANDDAAGALALLDEYATRFPRGRLAPEAMVLRIDALARTGHGAEAKKVAEKFLQRYPKSVLAARVRGYLE